MDEWESGFHWDSCTAKLFYIKKINHRLTESDYCEPS